jgi:malonyl CoA-acyl carrier protein transacylase
VALRIHAFTRVQGRVISGHIPALTALAEAAMSAGALKANQLAVAGAFHTALMQPASEALAEVRKRLCFCARARACVRVFPCPPCIPLLHPYQI